MTCDSVVCAAVAGPDCFRKLVNQLRLIAIAAPGDPPPAPIIPEHEEAGFAKLLQFYFNGVEDFVRNPRLTILAPHAWFAADSYDPATKQWNDKTGHGLVGQVRAGDVRKDVQAVGNGVNKIVPCISGSTEDRVDFGMALPEKHTVISMTRYNGPARGRILTGSGVNWLHGHHGGRAGVFFYENRPCGGHAHTNVPAAQRDNWVICSGQNNRHSPTDDLVFRTNGRDVGGAGCSPLAEREIHLHINSGSELSDWSVAEVIIFDRALSRDEIVSVEQYLATKYGHTAPELACTSGAPEPEPE